MIALFVRRYTLMRPHFAADIERQSRALTQADHTSGSAFSGEEQDQP